MVFISHSLQGCIQSASLRPGTHSFSFWTHRIWHKKNWMFMQLTNARKDMRTAYFTRKLNIPISHNGELIEFLKFQSNLLFSDFCSRMISFCQPLCPAWGFPRVAWHDLSCFFGETIADTFHLPPVVIKLPLFSGVIEVWIRPKCHFKEARKGFQLSTRARMPHTHTLLASTHDSNESPEKKNKYRWFRSPFFYYIYIYI